DARRYGALVRYGAVLDAADQATAVMGALSRALALLVLPAQVALGQSADLAWPEATQQSEPWTRWWWMGSAVDRENLTAELETLAAAGFGGVEVTSIYGVRGYEHAFVPYLSDRWLDLLLKAIPSGTIRAFFHDSFEYTGTGSAELFEMFRRRRGYDLRRYLRFLLGEGDPDVVARVKSDYRETMDEMLLDHLLRPLTAWAHERGSRSRNQAHGSPGNLLDLYAASDIPETELFGPLGGTDSDPLISKFASSAAHVAGRGLTSAETGTWLGEHCTVTLDQLKKAVDQLFVSGVNHVIYHGTAYSPREAAWPGWLLYASTDLNPRDALWRDLARAGATVIFVERLPADVPGLAQLQERRRRLEDAKRRLTLGQADRNGVRWAVVEKGRVLVGDRVESLLCAAGVRRERIVD